MISLKFFLFPLALLYIKAQGQFDSLQYYFHRDTLKFLVTVLAADSMEGRLTGSGGCARAARFIADEFQKAGVSPVRGNNKFFMPTMHDWVNVVGALRGKTKPGQLIIFSAHYDHIGTYSDENPFAVHPNGRAGDFVYNGANDDASGVAAVIALARYFALQNNNERTILFVAFAGEELGLLGSKHFVSQVEPDSIVAVINIEMVGKGYKRSSHPFITGSSYSNLAMILNKRLTELDQKKYGTNFFQSDHSNLFQRSDNYSFAQRGVPAHSIMGIGSNDSYYHSVADEARTLDYNFMSGIVQAIASGCRGLISGQDTPTRIKSHL